MGLDIVELVMEVEESFGITIPDDRGATMCTVGDLYAFILEAKRLQTRANAACLSASTFYALRRRLMPYLQGHRKIGPRTEVDATLPRRRRRRLWSRLAQEMDLRFPPLERPAWVMWAIGILAVVSAVAAFVLWAKLLIAVVVLVGAAAMLMLLSKPFAVLPAAGYRTYRGLVQQLVAGNYGTLSDRYQAWNPTDVWNVLRLIIVEQLGVPPEKVTPQANFVYDLGCG